MVPPRQRKAPTQPTPEGARNHSTRVGAWKIYFAEEDMSYHHVRLHADAGPPCVDGRLPYSVFPISSSLSCRASRLMLVSGRRLSRSGPFVWRFADLEHYPITHGHIQQQRSSSGTRPG